MKIVFLTLVLVILVAGGLWARSTFLGSSVEYGTPMRSGSLYDLKVTSLAGQPADLAAYRGKVVLVVNVASRCGNTPQYAGLEKLYREMAPKGLTILGFPSNDFGGQEPGCLGAVLFGGGSHGVR